VAAKIGATGVQKLLALISQHESEAKGHPDVQKAIQVQKLVLPEHRQIAVEWLIEVRAKETSPPSRHAAAASWCNLERLFMLATARIKRFRRSRLGPHFKFPSGVVHGPGSSHPHSRALCIAIAVLLCLQALFRSVLAQYLLRAGRCCRNRPTHNTCCCLLDASIWLTLGLRAGLHSVQMYALSSFCACCCALLSASMIIVVQATTLHALHTSHSPLCCAVPSPTP
jgi:hypothetical protein